MTAPTSPLRIPRLRTAIHASLYISFSFKLSQTSYNPSLKFPLVSRIVTLDVPYDNYVTYPCTHVPSVSLSETTSHCYVATTTFRRTCLRCHPLPLPLLAPASLACRWSIIVVVSRNMLPTLKPNTRQSSGDADDDTRYYADGGRFRVWSRTSSCVD